MIDAVAVAEEDAQAGNLPPSADAQWYSALPTESSSMTRKS